MKKALKIFGYTLGGLVAIIALFAAYIQFSSLPNYEVKAPDLKITPDSTRFAEGQRIVLTECAYCHRGTDGKLSGDLWANDPAMGKLWSANITNHPTAGIGEYTDGELAFLLRTGTKRDGHFAGPYMRFPLMSDEDVASVISFLRSDAPQVQASEIRTPAPELGFFGKMFFKLIVKPLDYNGTPVLAPAPSDTIAWGRYLVTGKLSCYSCHSAGFESNDELEPEKSKGYFGGGNPIADKENQVVVSANITPDRETGIGSWTETQFAEALRFGKRPDGKGLRPQMPPMSLLSDSEISAIWAYLKTVPAVKNPVARNFEGSSTTGN